MLIFLKTSPTSSNNFPFEFILLLMMKMKKKQFLFHSWKIRAEGRISLNLIEECFYVWLNFNRWWMHVYLACPIFTALAYTYSLRSSMISYANKFWERNNSYRVNALSISRIFPQIKLLVDFFPSIVFSF